MTSPYILCLNGGSLLISWRCSYWRFELTSGSEREAELNMMQCVFTGIPRVGKSSFWKRLQGMMPNRVIASTDITSSEGSVRLDVRGSCGFVLQVSEHGWRKLQAEEEMEGFVALVTQQGSPAIQDYLSVTSTAGAGQLSNVQSSLSQETTLPKQEGQPSVQPGKQKAEGVHEKPVKSASAHKGKDEAGQGSSTDGEAEKGGIRAAGVKEGQLPSASAVLKKALISMRQTELSKRIDSASYVLCTDTGGQPEFQELLSLLMAECNSVFIIFNMLHDLYSTLILQYLPSVDGEPVSYESPHTVAEMLYQSLISVPVESSGVRASETDSQELSGDGEILNRSSVFFIGTHKDKVSPQRIEAVNRELIELIRHTPQYKANIVQRCSASSIVFPVDNFSSLEKDDDFVAIRRATQGLVYGSHSRVKAPTSWLFTGIVLQNVSESQPVISLDQCQAIAQQCGVEQDSFKSCLKFLHKKVGAVRHYETEKLGAMVFIKPQVLINALSHLMRRAFLNPISRRAVVDDEDMNDAVTHFKSMTREGLIEIAMDLLVMCRHPNSTAQHPTYYLTCMLPVKREPEGLEESSVCFTMEGFVLPIGLGRATITAVVQQRHKTKTPWTIDYSTLYRNSVEFTVGSPASKFKISCSTKHLRLSVENAASVSRETCSDVRIAIESVMTDALKLYQYGQAKTPVVALVCPGCDRETSELHFASLVEEDRLECSRTKNSVGVEQHLRMWVLVSVHY